MYDKCYECPSSFHMIIIAIIFCVVMLLIAWSFRDMEVVNTSNVLAARFAFFSIIISFMKKVSISLNIKFHYPPWLLEYCEVLFNYFALDLSKLLISPECAWKWNFITRWVIYVYTPIGILIFIALSPYINISRVLTMVFRLFNSSSFILN